MVRSTPPLFPSDDGWPYPDVDEASSLWSGHVETEDPFDLDSLELRADVHAYDDLTEMEHMALFLHFGLDCRPVGMKDLGPAMGCSRADAREALGLAIDKMRRRLSAP
jgi:hypothetical protein